MVDPVVPEDRVELVLLRTAAGEICTAELVDVGFDHAGIRLLKKQAAPTLAIGVWVTCILPWHGARAPLEFHAQIQGRSESQLSRCYDVSFEEPLELESDLLRDLYHLINRRSAYRVGMGTREPIAIRLLTPDVQTTGRLRDLSTTGMGVVLVGPEVDSTFAAVEEVEIAFSLPPSNKVLKVPARIRNRRLEGETLTYGLQFIQNGGEAWKTDVMEYVERYREAPGE